MSSTDMSPTDLSSPAATVPVVILDDVFVLYQNVVALRGLSLALHRGERVVVRGPSGSGKSTLVNVVTGQVPPTAGVLAFTVDGCIVSGEALRRRGQLCVVTQGSGRELIPEISCERNVAITMQLAGASHSDAMKRAHQALAQFDISYLANRMPTDISSGEAQRVALAAALSASPSIIVADEPTGDLDRASADRVYSQLSAHVEETGAALLLVSHDERAEAIADRVLTIRDGRLERVRERGSQVSAFAIDPRGWMRLPEHERLLAGISDRAAVSLVQHEDSPSLRVASIGHARDPRANADLIDAAVRTAGELVATGTEISVTIDGITALTPVSFEVRRGDLTVIAGPSGSGKTTLLSVLGGLRGPSTGSLVWVDKPSKVFSAQVAGFADDATLRENVTLSTSLRNDNVNESELVDLLRALGIDALASRPVRTLSGGERQRTGVARALLCSAELMLIDEPTSQLDEVSARRTIEQLRVVARRGVAVVVASHDDAVIAAADVVVRVG
jgi:ABC-type lipoprotein export system ATPase subunit